MVCIIHGFPNSISALRFEWAWQNPQKSKRLREVAIIKNRKENPFQFRLRIACHMLNSNPWKRLALTFRWLLPECEIPFPPEIPPPRHIQMARGKVQKTNTVVPKEFNEYVQVNNCYLCQKTISQIKYLVRCLNYSSCITHFHARCLAEHALKLQKLVNSHLIPLNLQCPKCKFDILWGDVIRDQRILISIEEAKPIEDGVRIASGMIPLKLTKK